MHMTGCAVLPPSWYGDHANGVVFVIDTPEPCKCWQLLPFLAATLPFLAATSAFPCCNFCLSLLQCHIDMHVARSGSCFRLPRYESGTSYAAFQILQQDSMNHVFKGFVAFFLLASLFAWLPQ